MVKYKEHVCLFIAKRKLFSYLVRKPVSLSLLTELLHLIRPRRLKAHTLYDLWKLLDIDEKYYSLELCADILKHWLAVLYEQHEIDVKARVKAIVETRNHITRQNTPYLICGSVVDELVSDLSTEFPTYGMVVNK